MSEYNEETDFSPFVWCLHCEHVYDFNDWKNHQCPNCGAYELTDGWEWLKVARLNGYPDEPETGKEYPLYGPPKQH